MAFDSVSESEIWIGVKRRSINWKLSTGINSLYDRNRSYVRKNSMLSQIFEINNELRLRWCGELNIIHISQGRAIESRTSPVDIGYDQLNQLSICSYADDLIRSRTSKKS